MAHRVSQQLSQRRRGVPIAVAIGFLLLSGAGNLVAIRGAVELLESEPWERKKEELLIVELTEPEPRPKPEPEREEEPEPEKEPEEKPEFEIIEPEPEPEPEEEPEPEPEPELEPEPPPQEVEPPKIEPLDSRMKMVEQLDELDDNETNEDADYLSNIDRKVTEQTRADITNLEQDAKEVQASQLEPAQSPERGTSSEDVIAQTETQRSAKAREAPDVKPEKEDKRPEQTDPNPESLLATRELAPREHSEAMEAHEDLAIEAEDGMLAAAQLEAASVLERDQQAKIMRRDPRYQFKLSQDEMDALFGEDSNAPKNVESLQLSEKKGVWDDARKAYQSPLENMVPEVQVGNQTALNSRKHPFARYITAMHRSIHEAWAFGYLEMLEGHPASHPLNDMELWTRVEIVLNGDGTIDKVRTVHRSGNSSFDAAAREVVLASGPWPDPPKEIRSGNGKIYVHWAFHRNERACGTFGANPYILDNAGQGDIPNAHAEVHMHTGGSEETVRPLMRNGEANLVGSSHEDETEALRRGGEGSPVPIVEGPSRPPVQPEPGEQPQPGEAPALPPGGFGRGGGGSGSGGSGSGGSGVAIPGTGRMPVGPDGVPIARGGGGSSNGKSGGSGGVSLSGGRNNTVGKGGGGSSEAPESSEGPAAPDGEVDPAATAIAKNWVRAFTKGELTTVLNRSSVPFRYQSKIAAKSKEELEGLLAGLAEEVAGQTPKVEGTYTAAGLRKKYGSVAAGIEEGEGRVYTVVEIAGDTLILMLEKRFGSWRVIGMTR